MKLTNNAKALLETRYFQPGETWQKLTKRVVKAIVQAEKTDYLKKKYSELFTSIIGSREFVPASPFLMNANISNHYFSCYVLPIEDSLLSICKTIGDAAKIFQVAGGCGYSFSDLRPKGCKTTKNPLGKSSGPVSFMQVYNASCDEISSGGSRKGTQMAVLRIDHPDIEEFIASKEDLTKLNQFNISCGITDKFMTAVKNDEEFLLTFPAHPEKDKVVKAKDLWNKIIHNAWLTGDPGIIFLDEINRKDPFGGISATNPCSEQPLPSYGCCDLGSIDLAKMINKKGEFDWNRFTEIIHIATRFLDNAIDVNVYPLEKIETIQKGQRRIGLGIMGFADALIKLGIGYDSDEARRWAKDIVTVLDTEAREASRELAKEKGAFPLQKDSALKDDLPIRNATLTTIAPTGSVSIIAGCSGGIEPIFALAFTRKHNIPGHPELTEINQAFKQTAIERGFYSENLMQKITENNGSCQGIKEVPEDVQKIFKVSADIYTVEHVRMLSTWQQGIQSGVSKTVNLSEHATESDIEKVFWQAYESGCKGITVFRDKCRGDQVLNYGTQVKGRPMICEGQTMRVNTALGKMYITVNNIKKGNKPFEVFIHIAKGGTNAMADGEAIARLVSIALRSNVSVTSIVKQLKGIGAGEVTFNKGRAVSSIPDAIAYVLEYLYLSGEEKISMPNDKQKYFPSGLNAPVCLDCG